MLYTILELSISASFLIFLIWNYYQMRKCLLLNSVDQFFQTRHRKHLATLRETSTASNQESLTQTLEIPFSWRIGDNIQIPITDSVTAMMNFSQNQDLKGFIILISEDRSKYMISTNPNADTTNEDECAIILYSLSHQNLSLEKRKKTKEFKEFVDKNEAYSEALSQVHKL